MTYAISAQQMQDITEMVFGLNSFSNPDDNSRDVEGIEWGGGLRAVIGSTPIVVTSDYFEGNTYPEVIGYLIQNEFGWSFTQEKPKDA